MLGFIPYISQNSKMKRHLVLLALATAVHGHGYLSYPVARQYRCYVDDNFWWPSNGDAIPDAACRDAYKSVYYKYRSLGASDGEAANAAQYMFQQHQEFAAIAGPDYADAEHVRANVVRSGSMCAAGATDRMQVFGDKSGIDLPSPDWRRTSIRSQRQTIRFCPTTVHEPSYFEVYVSREGFDVAKQKLTWDDVERIDATHSLVDGAAPDDKYCSASQVYAIETVLPKRTRPFVLFVRWQRIDVVGEGFYNCADLEFEDEQLYASCDHRDRVCSTYCYERSEL